MAARCAMHDYVFDKTKRRYCYLRERGRCFYCGKRLNMKNATLDHYLPKTAGGPDSVYDLVLCCRSCNRQKGDVVPEDWQQHVIDSFCRAVADGALPLPPGSREKVLQAVAQGVQRVTLEGELVRFDGAQFSLYADSHRLVRAVYRPGFSQAQ